MHSRPVSDQIASGLGWLPVLVVVVAVGWVLAVGVLNLEQRSYGSELFISNGATSNQPEWAAGRDATAVRLQAALDSGDVGRMSSALGSVPSGEAAGATTAGG